MVGCSSTWSDRELDALLNIWLNDAIQQQLSGSYRNEAVYRKIEAELAKQDVDCS